MGGGLDVGGDDQPVGRVEPDPGERRGLSVEKGEQLPSGGDVPEPDRIVRPDRGQGPAVRRERRVPV